MAREARKRNNSPHLPRVERIELNDAHIKLRIVLVLLLLAVGLLALAYALNAWITPKTGWTEIEANPSDALSCADDFTFLYPLGAGGGSATAERKRIASLYTQAAIDAHQLFANDTEYDGVRNVRYINLHPNEEIEIAPALYAAFEQIAVSGDRSLYLAPIYAIYDGIFYCADDSLTADFDPQQDPELAEWFRKVCAYANDPEQVDLELLSDSRIRLNVSDDYRAFAQAEEIDSFIDFYWMKNAFIADYLADALAVGGVHIGTLSSFDGFARNLDTVSDTAYSLNLYDRVDQTIYPAAVMQYSGARSIVSLRSYPTGSQSAQYYRILADGEIRTAHLDARDGLCRGAIDDLTAYSTQTNCAGILLNLIPVYIADTFDADTLAPLAAAGIHTIYCMDYTIHHTEEELILTDLYNDGNINYKRAP